jgi:predicted HAD superfamily phosphohydrolase YqeG
MSLAYEQFDDECDLPRLLAEQSVQTAVLDIEPLVAPWNGSRDALDRGVARVVDQIAKVPGLRAVCFATNSARRPSHLPDVPGIRVSYVVSASKPLQLGPFTKLPRPGVVVGDQVMTDGLLARRLGYAFLHYRHPQGEPIGPRVLDGCGQLLRPLVFRNQS